MRKIIVSNWLSLDGFIEGPNQEIDWFVWDDATAEYARNLLNSIDTILFGRVTFELMASYWPSATTEDPVITAAMNNLPKVVFSKTLEKVEWKNSILVKENVQERVEEMKQQSGKDMVIFGSAGLVSTLTQLDLIDEFRIMLNPVVLGTGTPQFKGIRNRINLRLVKTRTFHSGLVLLYYQFDRN